MPARVKKNKEKETRSIQCLLARKLSSAPRAKNIIVFQRYIILFRGTTD